MKKRVPDPPIPYISIINHLTVDEVRDHAAVLMSTIHKTADVYLAFKPEDRPEVLVDNLCILAQLLQCLFEHARSQEVAP